jgi:hypothetical protein
MKFNAWNGKESKCMERHGMAWHGMRRKCMAREGKEGHGKE